MLLESRIEAAFEPASNQIEVLWPAATKAYYLSPKECNKVISNISSIKKKKKIALSVSKTCLHLPEEVGERIVKIWKKKKLITVNILFKKFIDI